MPMHHPPVHAYAGKIKSLFTYLGVTIPTKFHDNFKFKMTVEYGMEKVWSKSNQGEWLDPISSVRLHAANRAQSQDRLASAIICSFHPPLAGRPSFHVASLIRPKSPTCTLVDEPSSDPISNKNTVHLFTAAYPNALRSARSARIIANCPPNSNQLPRTRFHAHGPRSLPSFPTPSVIVPRFPPTRLHIRLLQQTSTLCPSRRMITAAVEYSSYFALARHLTRMNLPTTEPIFTINAT